MRKRDVFLNGERASGTAVVRSGDMLDLYCAPDMIKLREVYRNSHLLVLAKPRGIATDALTLDIPATGIYLLQLDGQPAHRIAVVK